MNTRNSIKRMALSLLLCLFPLWGSAAEESSDALLSAKRAALNDATAIQENLTFRGDVFGTYGWRTVWGTDITQWPDPAKVEFFCRFREWETGVYKTPSEASAYDDDELSKDM
jgi:hypothetical protein